MTHDAFRLRARLSGLLLQRSEDSEDDVEEVEDDQLHKLFCGGFPWSTTVPQLLAHLNPRGIVPIEGCIIIPDRIHPGRRSRGFGFVTVRSSRAAVALIRDMSGTRLGGRRIRLNYATKKPGARHEKALFRTEFAVQCRRVCMGSWTGKDEIFCEELADGSVNALFAKIDRKKNILRISGKFGLREYYMNVRVSSIADFAYDHRNQTIVVSLRNPPALYERSILSTLMEFGKRDDRVTKLPSHRGGIFQFHSELVITLENRGKRIAKLMRWLERRVGESWWDHNESFRYVYRRPKSLLSLYRSTLPESVFYLIMCNLSHCVLSEWSLSEKFLRALQSCCTSPKGVFLAEEFLVSLFHDGALAHAALFHPEIDFEGFLKTTQEVMSFRWDQKEQRDRSESSEFFHVKRIYVSPTRIWFSPSEEELGNRVLRHFHELQDRFVRVCFTDEDDLERRVYYSKSIGDQISGILKNGINIGPSHFRFLAFSNSQLRSRGLWLFNDKGCSTTCENIRSWMGDFSMIHNVAKFAARMGMTFSTTRETAQLTPEEFAVIDDTKRGKYIFTDGCGMISQRFAREIVLSGKLGSKLRNRARSGKPLPSCFQLRFAGFKGLVVTYDFSTLRPELSRHVTPQTKLILRKSQRKFTSPHYVFEVIRVESFRPCYLNRQVISLLSTLGIPDQTFLDVQNDMLRKLRLMFHDRATAVEVVKQYAGNNGLSSMLIPLIESLSEGGLEVSLADPFVSGCLESLSWFKVGLFTPTVLVSPSQRLELKCKCKLLVRNGSLLFGVCDETDSLEYGQVFVQVDWGRPHLAKVITGLVAVAKNPCFAPGDLRVLNAVDVPALRHLRNVVVFPTKGPRDHPNECSGSDLDGDVYVVVFDSKLVPRGMYEPMDYTPPLPKRVFGPIRVPQITEFFIDAMKNDVLGRVANAHLAHYAFSRDGVRDPVCVKLAELHSVAVDFPKTGVPAVMGFELNPKKYPLFMEKEDKFSQESTCVIGQLYREVVQHMSGPRKKRSMKWSEVSKQLNLPGHEAYLKEAKELLGAYNYELDRLLRQYGIWNETDAWSYLFCKYVSHLRPKRFEQVRDSLVRLAREYRRIFQEEFKEEEGEEEEEGEVSEDEKAKQKLARNKKMAQKASAWYVAAYSQPWRKSKSKKRWRRRRKSVKVKEKPPLLSFGFINIRKLRGFVCREVRERKKRKRKKKCRGRRKR